jgi:hypothetical protein
MTKGEAASGSRGFSHYFEIYNLSFHSRLSASHYFDIYDRLEILQILPKQTNTLTPTWLNIFHRADPLPQQGEEISYGATLRPWQGAGEQQNLTFGASRRSRSIERTPKVKDTMLSKNIWFGYRVFHCFEPVTNCHQFFLVRPA